MSALPQPVEDYLRRLSSALAPLPIRERDEIVSELRAHFAERAAEGHGDLLASFEPADVYASQFLEARTLEGAIADGGSWKLGAALVRSARHAVESLLFVSPLLALQFFALGLLATGLAKPFAFDHVGWFDPPDGRFRGIGWISDTTGCRDVLGWWTVPAFVVPSVLVLFFSARALRWIARSRLARSRRPGLGLFLPSAQVMGPGGSAIGHGGDIFGFHSTAFFFTERSTVIVGFANKDGESGDEILGHALGAVFGHGEVTPNHPAAPLRLPRTRFGASRLPM